MSLFQCQHCGCCENTACACQGCKGFAETFFDWTGFEDRKGKLLCSACAPTKHTDGTPSGMGQWHGEFPRTFLPMGMFKTNARGNLEHIETGNERFCDYAVPPSEQTGKEST